MSDNLKIQLISAANTFAITFVTVVSAGLEGGIEWTTAFWISIATTGGRAGLKAVINLFLPVKLGGKK